MPASAMESVGTRSGTATGQGWTDTGAPTTVQKELMRHASIQTTMNVYGKAITDSKRRAHSKVVELILKPRKTTESTRDDHAVAAGGA